MERSTIEDAIRELDALIAIDSPNEKDYQDWFERNPIAMVALGFQRHVPHPIIPLGAGKSFIPDFLVQLPDRSWDIFELKTPQTKVLLDRERRATFYAEFATYVSQCHDYSEAFDDRTIREAFERTNGFSVQKRPHSIIVAGRSDGLDGAKVRQITARYTPPIRHYTFDDIRGQLEHYRTFNFGPYDSARGLALFFVLRLVQPPNSFENNHIFDVGETADRDHISVFLNPNGYFRLVVFDSNGERHDASSAVPFSPDDYARVHYIYMDVGVADRFGFLTIEIDGQYYADLRIENFPLQLSREYGLGTNSNGTGKSWMDAMVIGVYNKPLSFKEKGDLREDGYKRANAALTDPNAAFVSFRGNQFLSTEKHPSKQRDSLP